MAIADLLGASEGKTLEFKQDLSSPRNLLKTLVAFANTAGGRVIIGVENATREPLGLEHPLDEEERLCNLIHDAISPRLVPSVEMVTVKGKTLLIVEVFLSNARPHYLSAEGAEQGVYVRLGSTNRHADSQLIAEMRRAVEGVCYDELPMPLLSVADLDSGAIQIAFAQRGIDEQKMSTLKLLVKDQSRLVPSRGGMILFGRERLSHFPDCWVQCGRFLGLDKSVIFDHIEIEGSLPSMVDEILLFLKKHAMRGADLSGVRRQDIWSVPLSALREAVVNALVHADWSQRSGPVRVAFFDDRIEIENPGILPPGLTVEDMRQGVSKIRNPVLARVFREIGLIEQWGSGIPRIFRDTAMAGFPEPFLVEMGLRVRMVFPLRAPINLMAGSDPYSGLEEVGTDQVEGATDQVVSGTDQVASPTDQVRAKTDQVETSTDQVRDKTDQVASGTDQVASGTDQVASGTDQVETSTDQVRDKTDQVASGSDQVEPDHGLGGALAKVAAYCRKPRTAREMMKLLGLKHRGSFQRNYLNPLLEQGMLERTIPSKPNSRLQRYRLTAKGRGVLTWKSNT